MFIDDELRAADHDSLFKHLSECADCRLYLQWMLRLREIEHREQVAYPADLDDKILAVAGISVSRQIQPLWRRSVRLSIPVAAAAVFLIVLLSVVLSNLLFPTDRSRTADQDVSYAQQMERVTVLYALPPLVVYPDSSGTAGNSQK